jgi:hypothetical protein
MIRANFETKDWYQAGLKQTEEVYRGVDNPEVRIMMGRYFPDISQCLPNLFLGERADMFCRLYRGGSHLWLLLSRIV